MGTLIRFQPSNKGIHAVGTGLFHLVRDVSVNVQSESSGMMAQIFLHRFYIVPGLQGSHSVRMAQVC